MTTKFAISTLFALGAFALVSCETQQSRVVERPIGTMPTYPTVPGTTEGTANNGSSIVEQLNAPSGGVTTPPIDGASSATQSSGNTLGALVPNPNNTNTTPGTPVKPKEDIPTAWLDPSDPTVVRSPYNPENKVRIIKPDGTPYPSGTIFWDPRYPKSENKKFRIP